MRITGGNARGIPLTSGKSRLTRPATDRLREAVFSSLAGRVIGARFLDLFAGTGSYGLEALSRGAESGCFVEADPAAIAALRANLQAVAKSMGIAQPTDRAHIIRGDVLKVAPPDGDFTMVFIDAPYDWLRRHFQQLLPIISAATADSENAAVVIEFPGDMSPEIPDWTCRKRIGRPAKNEPNAAIFIRA